MDGIMVWVECIVMDLKSGTTKGRYYKTFELQADFNSWYKIVKTDYDTAINFMRYDFNEKTGLKSVRDAMLSRLPRVEKELSI
jgi:hypothetical protein